MLETQRDGRESTNASSHTFFAEEPSPEPAAPEQTSAMKKKRKRRSAAPAQAPQMIAPSSALALHNQASERKRRRNENFTEPSNSSFMEETSPEPDPAEQTAARKKKRRSTAPSPAAQRMAPPSVLAHRYQHLASLLREFDLAELLEPILSRLHTATELTLYSEGQANMKDIVVGRTFYSEHETGTVYYKPDVVRQGSDARFIGVRFGQWSKGTWQWGARARVSIPKDDRQKLRWVRETLDEFRTLPDTSLFPVCSSPSIPRAQCGYRVKDHGEPGAETLDRYQRAILTQKPVNLDKNWTGPDLGPAIEELLRFRWRASGKAGNPIIVGG